MNSKEPQAHSKTGSHKPETQTEVISAELIPLFRILIAEPAKDHDFKVCPVCDQYGLTEI